MDYSLQNNMDPYEFGYILNVKPSELIWKKIYRRCISEPISFESPSLIHIGKNRLAV